MAKNMYIGVEGVSRKVKAGYIGVSGVARKFTDALEKVTVTIKAGINVGGYVYTSDGQYDWPRGETISIPAYIGQFVVARSSRGYYAIEDTTGFDLVTVGGNVASNGIYFFILKVENDGAIFSVR